MKWIHYLIFEISNDCNLASAHTPLCPIKDPERYGNQKCDKALSDGEIVRLASAIYEEYGFRGFVGFHFYNEPTIAWDRMMLVIREIKNTIRPGIVPRFGLLSNGVLLIPEKIEGLKQFHQIAITNYQNRDWSWLNGLAPYIDIIKPGLDNRVNPVPQYDNVSCGRIFNEMIIDYYGNVHPCCMDWRGEIPLGNVQDEAISHIIDRYQKLRSSIYPMSPMAPVKCKTCFARAGGNISTIDCSLSETIRQEVAQALSNKRY
jgi:radical SAM protein with 4Fe4S-binding SPASM domain